MLELQGGKPSALVGVIGGVRQPFIIFGPCCPLVGVTGTFGLDRELTCTSQGGVGGATLHLATEACRARNSSRIVDTLASRGDAYFRNRTVDGLWRCCDKVIKVCESYFDDQSDCTGIGRFKMHRARASEARAMSDGRFAMNSLWNRAISEMYVAMYSTSASYSNPSKATW